jgi:hypothetical protein
MQFPLKFSLKFMANLLIHTFILSDSIAFAQSEYRIPTRINCIVALNRASSLSNYGRERVVEAVRQLPDIDNDELVKNLTKTILSDEKAISFYEKSSLNDLSFRRTIRGYVRRSPSTIVIDIFNINAEPLTIYDTDPLDGTTAKIIYAAQKAAIAIKKSGNFQVLLMISTIVNSEYKAALRRWGFIPFGDKALVLELDGGNK